MKTYTIIAGVNGVGKSSLTGVLLKTDSSLGIIIDTDSITRHLNGNRLKGGKEAVMRIERCLDAGLDFTQETTLSGKKTLQTILKARDKGYYIRLFYVGVNSAEESIARIANRVKKGGHDIPTDDVIRRYHSRFDDLIKVLPYCNFAAFYDNENGFQYIAEYNNGVINCVGEYCPPWLDELKAKSDELMFSDSDELNDDQEP